MPNAERIDQVIASIRGEVERTASCGFNMNYPLVKVTPAVDEEGGDLTQRGCGTVACIAGHAYVLASADRTVEEIAAEERYLSVFETAQQWLGLDEKQRGALFFGYGSHFEDDLGAITPDHAIKVLEDLKVSGTIDWDKHSN